MNNLTDYSSYADAQAHANIDGLWALFDGDKDYFNIAHEAMTRHAKGDGRAAVRIASGESRRSCAHLRAFASARQSSAAL